MEGKSGTSTAGTVAWCVVLLMGCWSGVRHDYCSFTQVGNLHSEFFVLFRPPWYSSISTLMPRMKLVEKTHFKPKSRDFLIPAPKPSVRFLITAATASHTKVYPNLWVSQEFLMLWAALRSYSNIFLDRDS